MAKLPNVIKGLICPPEAGRAAKMHSGRIRAPRRPAIIGKRNGDVTLYLSIQLLDRYKAKNRFRGQNLS